MRITSADRGERPAEALDKRYPASKPAPSQQACPETQRVTKKALSVVGNQYRLASMVGVRQGAVGHWLHGRRKASPQRLAQMRAIVEGEG